MVSRMGLHYRSSRSEDIYMLCSAEIKKNIYILFSFHFSWILLFILLVVVVVGVVVVSIIELAWILYVSAYI